MLLQRFINRAALISLLMAALLFAACGGSSPLRSSSGTEQSGRADAPPTGGPGESAIAIPPVVLTLFEQATASMAAGDFIDAELRFKAFLLQYPDYPGAYVNLAIIHASSGNDAAARLSVRSRSSSTGRFHRSTAPASTLKPIRWLARGSNHGALGVRGVATPT